MTKHSLIQHTCAGLEHVYSAYMEVMGKATRRQCNIKTIDNGKKLQTTN